jgi:hypothetical protein
LSPTGSDGKKQQGKQLRMEMNGFTHFRNGSAVAPELQISDDSTAKLGRDRRITKTVRL